MITLDVTHPLRPFTLDVSLQIGEGITALSGTSGAGKTTLLKIIAGLIRPRNIKLEMNGVVLADSAGNIFVPPHLRQIAYVFQEARLFPHLSVRQNLFYGYDPAKAERNGIDSAAIIALLGLTGLLERRTRNLSGGEQQRVAIGRAVLSAPRLLLMDEPLASLDAARREDILAYIEGLRDRLAIPILYVSHSVQETQRLAGKVIVLEQGHVVSPSAINPE